uniref:arginine kinase n=1 Tax=Ditylenchus dipsaci TaxID=166011 RepID=A0A915EM86_9BILA
MADETTIKKIEEGFSKLQVSADCKSLLKKHLTKEVKDKLKNRKTSLGATLFNVISSGVANLDSGIGVYAADAECYKVFSDLFDAVIQEYHGFKPTDKQPAVELGKGRISELAPLDVAGKYIKSTRIRCGRTLKGFRQSQESLGRSGRSVARWKVLPSGWNDKGGAEPAHCRSFSLQGRRSFLASRQCVQFWPKGRGIFHNKDKTFLVWVNEEDHLRLISMQNNGNVGEVLERLIKGIEAIESKVPFSRDDRLGWLTFCPTNWELPAKPDFKDICDKLKLQIRGIHGEHSDSSGGVYDISNKARLGLTEFEAVKQMYDGVKHLIELEEKA